MKALIWKIRALYWFWRLARYPSWEAATVLYDQLIEYGDAPAEWAPADAVREELSNWVD